MILFPRDFNCCNRWDEISNSYLKDESAAVIEQIEWVQVGLERESWKVLEWTNCIAFSKVTSTGGVLETQAMSPDGCKIGKVKLSYYFRIFTDPMLDVLVIICQDDDIDRWERSKVGIFELSLTSIVIEMVIEIYVYRRGTCKHWSWSLRVLMWLLRETYYGRLGHV